MADGGTSPIGDPGNLSIYSLHGGTNKMVELISDVSGEMDMLQCQPDGHHGMFTGPNQAALYPVQSDLVSGGYIQVDPLNYGDNSSYEELKRSSTVPNYYGSSDNIHNTDHIFNSHSLANYQSNQQEMLKTSSADSMGYIQLLSNTENLGHDMVIKKEKLDFSDDLNMLNSQSPDIPYPPNTCISDWNFYNSAMNLPTSSKTVNHSASNYNVFQVPSMSHHQPQYLPGSMYENSSHMPTIPMGLSNEDIHNQAKKISHEIMHHGWNSENLYKSQLYSNVNADAINRKRKPEIERPNKPIKSRRKKSEIMDGHSKTVASILMADNHLSTSSKSATGSSSWLDNQVLDSTERNVVLSSLMENLRSTVQFESFCLSFPRSQGKEDAFRKKILHAANMINDIPSMMLKSSTISEEYITRASKIISSFKSALLNTGHRNGKQALTGDKFNNLRSDQVEEHLPHSMVWAVKVDDHLLTANWEGQFVTTVNPEQSVLSFSLFQFQPCFSADGIKCLQHAKLTKTLAEDILGNMRQFEVSRQLRFDVKLQCIREIYLFPSCMDVDCGCLVIEISEKPVYFQRWIHSSAENKNKWKRRKSFFKPTHSRSKRYISIGGLMSELNELVALILTSNHDLETLYEQGTIEPLRMDLSVSYENGYYGFTEMDEVQVNRQTSNGIDRQSTRFGQNCKVLKSEIVQILIQNHIENDAKSVTVANSSAYRTDHDENRDYCDNLSIELNENRSECFRDYVNFTCNSAKELSLLLALKVNPSAFGFCDSDFDLRLVPGRDIESLTVGQLVSSQCSDIVYFSFCYGKVGQLGHEKHCSKCRTCNTWRFWHCDTCNKCTDSGQVCDFCGHLRDDQSSLLIKPRSIFKSQEDSGKLVLEVEKEEWRVSLNLPDDDVINWEFPKVPLTDNTNCVMKYDSTNAMVDQLGLLNPVGFLLGQPASSASRKHRRYKESRSFGKQSEGHFRNTISGAASACNIQ